MYPTVASRGLVVLPSPKSVVRKPHSGIVTSVKHGWSKHQRSTNTNKHQQTPTNTVYQPTSRYSETSLQPSSNAHVPGRPPCPPGGMLVPGRSVETMFAAGYDLVCTTSDVILLRATAENIAPGLKPVRWKPVMSSGRRSEGSTFGD